MLAREATSKEECSQREGELREGEREGEKEGERGIV